MKKYVKKFSVMFLMALVLMLGYCVSAFASDDGVVGIANLNNTTENSAKVGLQLKAPEKGWRRADDSNSLIKYSGSGWFFSAVSGVYDGTQHATKNLGDTVSFRFYGTKLRILCSTKTTDNPTNVGISVDGVNSTYNHIVNGTTTLTPQIILYEKTGLTLGIHTVVITSPSSTLYTGLDSIDIDDIGCLVPYDYNKSISLSQSTMDLNVGNSQSLTSTTTPAGAGVTWKSSDSSVATVDSTGKVTAVGEGTCTITATINDGYDIINDTCTVNVTNPITPAITLNKTSDSLTIGQTDNLVATTTSSGAQVTWTSSDTNIATVDSTGKITAIKAGTVTITASTSNGLTVACAVTVINPTDNSGGTDGTSTIVNIAHAKGDNTNNAGGDVSIIFNGLPDTTLSVVKTADVKSVYVGDTFTYTIVVTNTGAKTAKSVVINDSAPNHIQFMPSGITTTQGTVDPSSTSSNILVNVGDIPPLGTVTIKVPATVIL